MDNEELSKILKTISEYYSTGIENWELLPSYHHIKKLLRNAARDNRTARFKKCVEKDNKDISITDMSTYSLSTTCLKFKFVINDASKNRYLMFFYISFISDYYAYKIRKIYGGQADLANLIRNEKDTNLLNKLKLDELRMNLSEQNEKRMQILNGIPKYKKAIEKANLFKNNNPLFFNEHPKVIEHLIRPILNCQQQIFDYRLFDKHRADFLVEGIETNMKQVGKATLFDCVFTDYDDLSRLF